MKKQLHNIFSSKKEKPKETPNKKMPIIIDTREKNSLISANLIEQKANIEFEKLDIADYRIGEVAIERKTFQDFLSSMINKRLLKQLTEIKKYEKPVLLLEGFYYDYENYNVHENAIRGMINSIATEFKIPIIYTENEKDTAKYLINLAKKQEKIKPETSIRHQKTIETIDERKQFILEGFPGVGAKKAKKLLEEYKSLNRIFKLKKEELKNILDDKTIESWEKLLNN
jgi:ERCC4-type nuclease